MAGFKRKNGGPATGGTTDMTLFSHVQHVMKSIQLLLIEDSMPRRYAVMIVALK